MRQRNFGAIAAVAVVILLSVIWFKKGVPSAKATDPSTTAGVAADREEVTGTLARVTDPQPIRLGQPEMLKKCARMVVRIESYKPNGNISQGTGIVVRRDGLIITCYHVIRNSKRIRVADDWIDTTRVNVIRTDPDRDIALLRVDARNPPVAEPLQTVVQRQTAVYSLANPLGIDDTISPGSVVAVEMRGDVEVVEFSALQITAVLVVPYSIRLALLWR